MAAFHMQDKRALQVRLGYEQGSEHDWNQIRLYLDRKQKNEQFSYGRALAFSSLSVLIVTAIYTQIPQAPLFQKICAWILPVVLHYGDSSVYQKTYNQLYSELLRDFPGKMNGAEIHRKSEQALKISLQNKILFAAALTLSPFFLTADLFYQILGLAINLTSIAIFGLRAHIDAKAQLVRDSDENLSQRQIQGESLVHTALSAQTTTNLSQQEQMSLELSLADRLIFLHKYGKPLLQKIQNLEREFGCKTIEQLQIHLSFDLTDLPSIQLSQWLENLKVYAPASHSKSADQVFTDFYKDTVELQRLLPKAQNHLSQEIWMCVRDREYFTEHEHNITRKKSSIFRK